MPVTMMKSKKIIAAALTLALLAFLLPGQACAALKDYKDAERGFSFSYPETWELRRTQLGSIRVFTTPSDGISANFSVTVAPPWEEEYMTADAIAGVYKGGAEKVEILSHKKTKLKGVPCVAVNMIYTTMSDQKLKIRQQVYMANYKGKGYIIVAGAASEDYGKSERFLKAILDSFKF